ncbi:MAG: 23S rRNA (uracil(1939)-C(5))-methyltransferase RlmD [Lachnospiraceae bacterium]|nr:23S rRNA (uracil(1939)-C(5))-methyltransferase RlmD [Lachnospiraceae bacterium]
MNKNDIVEVAITDMSDQGEGIGKTQDGGLTFFVKDAIVGDFVRAVVTKVMKNYCYAKMLEVITPSPDRVPARCKVARACGGCQFQEIAYDVQLKLKRETVIRKLRHIGHIAAFDDDSSISPPEGKNPVYVAPTLGMDDPWRYRNKTQLPIGYDREKNLVAGFYAGRTHAIIAHEDCLLADAGNAEIARIVLAHMNRYKISAYDENSHTGLVRHLLIRHGHTTGQWMVCIIINGRVKDLLHADELVATLKEHPGMASISVNINTKNTNVILGEETILLYGTPYIEDTIGNLKFHIGPHSFFQVNPVQTEKLYGCALDFAGLTGNEVVWDLYCGIGTISLFLAQKAKKVYGVEIVPQAIENAKDNALLNSLLNTEFMVGSAEDVAPLLRKRPEAAPDVVVVDPPRKGCDGKLLETMLAMAPQRIVYVSCDPATLARDLAILLESGDYRLEKVQPVDMFPMAGHVETVALLEKLNK